MNYLKKDESFYSLSMRNRTVVKRWQNIKDSNSQYFD